MKSIGLSFFEIHSTVELLKKEPQRASSYINALQSVTRKFNEFLEGKEVEVIDHTGMPYPLNVKVEVLGTETDPTVEKPFVSETMEPTVFYKGQLIHRAKVFVTEKR